MPTTDNQDALPDLDLLREEFSELEDWDERYEYLIEIGRLLPAIAAESQTAENLVHGCMSTVWLVTRVPDPGRRIVQIEADSDSLIIKGLIVLLKAIFADMTPEEIVQHDERAVFREFGLDQHLSPQRRNGLFAMVKRLKTLAAQWSSLPDSTSP